MVSAGRLYLVGGGAPSGVQRVAIAGRLSEPVWSDDGKWLAVVSQPPPPKKTPYADEPAAVWLVAPSGEVVRPLTPHGVKVHAAAAAWSPTADRLAISYAEHGRDHLDIVDPRGAMTALLRARQISWFAWAPDGMSLAVGRNWFVKPVTGSSWRSELDVFPASGGIPHVLAYDKGGVYDVAGWWPDGSGVLAWIDPMGSGSLAADGLPLYDFGLNGHRRRLGRTLQYRPWIATSRPRDEVAFIAGGDRELTNDHKHLVVCSPVHCDSKPQPANRVSFDPAFAADGRLALVRDRAVAPSQANGGFSSRFTANVDASGGVDVVRGRSVEPLAGGGGASAPVWGRDGSLLVEKDGSLWLVAVGSASPQRVAGPMGVADEVDTYYPGDPGWYYGFVGWWDSFAWSRAVG